MNKPINTSINIHCSGHVTHRYKPVLCTIVCICDGTPELHYLLSKSYHTALQYKVEVRVQDKFGAANKLLDWASVGPVHYEAYVYKWVSTITIRWPVVRGCL